MSVSIPSTRDEFKKLVLRQLGAPVLEINVSDTQVEDAINLGLSYYADYHFDGSEKVYFTHPITAQDKTNKYISVPESISGVVRVFPIGDALSVQNMFSIRYQIALNDLYTLTNLSLVPYYQAMQYVQLIEQILVGRQPVRFQRHNNRILIDMDWSKILTGEYLVFECYQVLDPKDYPDVWKDRWLAEYVSALVKKQWGTNLKKFRGVKLPGGIELDGKTIYDEAVEELNLLRSRMSTDYSIPPRDFIG